MRHYELDLEGRFLLFQLINSIISLSILFQSSETTRNIRKTRIKIMKNVDVVGTMSRISNVYFSE